MVELGYEGLFFLFVPAPGWPWGRAWLKGASVQTLRVSATFALVYVSRFVA